MSRVLLILMVFFALSALARAEAAPSAEFSETTIEAQADAALASVELDRAVAQENQAKINLEKAAKALAKKPKAAKLKKTLDAAKKELAAASRQREKAAARLKEETAEKIVAAKKPEPAPKKVEAASTATVYSEYSRFLKDSDSAERLDPYSFFNDPIDFKGKTIVVDANFDTLTSPDQAKFIIWRNFGKMPLIVSGFSAAAPLSQNQSALIYGVITDFKNVVVSGELVLHAMVQLRGLYVCVNLCPKDGLQKVM